MENNILECFNLSENSYKKFEKYYNILIEENSKINLTSITDYKEVYVKHFYDSLMILKFKDISNLTICDIGSGAGFPSIPLAIVDDSIKLTIIEPTLKRVNFLRKLCQELDLKNVNIINNRAEDEIINYREKFDIVTARAVASLPILLELCIPYVKVSGVFIALKGVNFEDELIKAKNAHDKLNVEYQIETYQLPLDMGGRSIIKYRKIGKTNNIYPRKYSLIKKCPL